MSETQEKLPAWDLSSLYASRKAPEIEQDLAQVKQDIEAFAARHDGAIDESTPAAHLAEAIRDYEIIEERLSRLMSYAGLVQSEDMSDPERLKFMSDMCDQVTALSAQLVFFTLALNGLSDEALQEKIAEHEGLAHYKPWLRVVRAQKPFELSPDLERLLYEKQVTSAAWVRLYDETLAELRVSVGEQSLTLEEALHRLSDPIGAKREEAAKGLAHAFAAKVDLFALVTNTLAKDKSIEEKWRGYPDPAMARHLSNDVETDVVEALVTAVSGAYEDLSHRYYTLKAKWMGKTRLDYWDRNAPLEEAEETPISWAEAQEIISSAYGSFSPSLADLAKQFFDKPWIDAAPRPGKAGGAFSHPTVPSANPFILLNYMGKRRDVMTLAHELGHGVHQLLAAPQGQLMASTPLTLAETASVFGEMLTFQSLVAQESSPAIRKALLAGKVEDMLNTVVRQVAFYQFERRVHLARREGELSVDDIGRHWLTVQSESLGPAIVMNEGYEHYWSYVSHFIHAPFYVYAYAFGDCLVNALYAVYQEGKGDFESKYMDMLRAGGSLHHKDLLAPFGLDASDPAFWSKGLALISSMIDELEALA